VLQMLKEIKRKRNIKKHRQLNLSNSAWEQIGEIYARILVNKGVSLSNEEIIEMSVEIMHKKIVKEGRLSK
jgi:hypothetical protein